jgi:hypothetical protein
MRNLLRTAISSIVYLRNIFPENCFKDRTLTGINIKALVPCTDDAKLLISWLEKGIHYLPEVHNNHDSNSVIGVFDALEKKYVSDIKSHLSEF